MKKKWLVGGVVVVVVAGAGVMLGGRFMKPGVVPAGAAQAKAEDSATAKGGKGKDGKDGKPEVTLEFVPREVVQPALARLPVQLEFSGPLVAPQTAQLRAKAGGTLVALTVVEGQRVAAGQPIGRIDMAEAASRAAERSAMLESARATLAQAERTHASNERLAAQQFISPIALETSRAGVDTARAALAAAQAALATTQVALRDASLVAPIAGIVAKRHVLPGEKVAVEQPVLTIVDLARLELAGTVGTHQVSRLAAGLAVQVQVEGLAQPVAGRIARIAPAAEPGTRSIGVTVELPNPKETLRAGQYAMVRATLADDTERMTLPATAVGSTSGQDHVWVIEAGQLARRAVTLGRRDERSGRVEVLSGLGADSQVLAARFDNLREGAKATVVADRSDKSDGPDKAAPMASAATGATVR